MALLDGLVNRPHPQKVILAVIGSLLIGAVGYLVLLAPMALERDTLSLRNQALKDGVARARVEEAGMRALGAQAAALRARLRTARDRMPAEKEIPALYRRIADLAGQSGLSVALFAPRPPEEREGYREVAIAIAAEASYHQLGRFFEHLGRLPRIVSTSDMRLVGIDRPTGTVRAEVGLATYVWRPEGAAGRPEGAAGRPEGAAGRPEGAAGRPEALRTDGEPPARPVAVPGTGAR
jgi:Tfp pilus assembly protein PilO